MSEVPQVQDWGGQDLGGRARQEALLCSRPRGGPRLLKNTQVPASAADRRRWLPPPLPWPSSAAHRAGGRGARTSSAPIHLPRPQAYLPDSVPLVAQQPPAACNGILCPADLSSLEAPLWSTSPRSPPGPRRECTPALHGACPDPAPTRALRAGRMQGAWGWGRPSPSLSRSGGCRLHTLPTKETECRAQRAPRAGTRGSAELPRGCGGGKPAGWGSGGTPLTAPPCSCPALGRGWSGLRPARRLQA